MSTPNPRNNIAAKFLTLIPNPTAAMLVQSTPHTALSLLFLTGMRAGELRALRWESDIDFDNNIIHIQRTKDRYGPRSPKTKNSNRTFPISENIRSLLLAYQEWHEGSMTPYQFRNPIGYAFFSPT